MLGPQPPFLSGETLARFDAACRRDPDGSWPQALEVVDDLLAIGQVLPEGGEAWLRKAMDDLRDEYPALVAVAGAALDYRTADWASAEGN